jgi:hypothetical protein
MGYLTKAEREYVRSLKNEKILKTYTPEQLRGITKNGGVAIFCGDGDIDVRKYHERTISDRPHAQEFFGGSLIHSRAFGDYDESFAQGALKNMFRGMGAKETQRVFLYPHYPCGMATFFRHGIYDVFRMAADVHLRFIEEYGFNSKLVYSFFHVKRMNRGMKEEQNTYIFDVARFLGISKECWAA